MAQNPTAPPAPEPAAAGHLPPEQFDRWYGGWDPLDPEPPSGTSWRGSTGRGGSSAAGASRSSPAIGRDHEDMDISILSSDAGAFREFLGDRWTPWNVDDGWFRPFDQRFTDVRPDSQVWVRRDAQSRWVLDVPFTPDTDGRWTNKRHLDHTEDLDDVTWVAPDGLRYARPEVTLMFKAAQAREKDRRDAEATLPLLDDQARDWLSRTMARMDPAHPWARRPLRVTEAPLQACTRVRNRRLGSRHGGARERAGAGRHRRPADTGAGRPRRQPRPDR